MRPGNLVMFLLGIVCALSVVTTTYRARTLFANLEKEQARGRQLTIEYGQLQLEQRTWADHTRVEKIARSQLGMVMPRAPRVIYPAPPVTPTTPAGAQP